MLEKALRWQGKLYGLKDKVEVTYLDTIGKISPYEKKTVIGTFCYIGNKNTYLEVGDWYKTEDKQYRCNCVSFDWHTILDIKRL